MANMLASILRVLGESPLVEDESPLRCPLFSELLAAVGGGVVAVPSCILEQTTNCGGPPPGNLPEGGLVSHHEVLKCALLGRPLGRLVVLDRAHVLGAKRTEMLRSVARSQGAGFVVFSPPGHFWDASTVIRRNSLGAAVRLLPAPFECSEPYLERLRCLEPPPAVLSYFEKGRVVSGEEKSLILVKAALARIHDAVTSAAPDEVVLALGSTRRRVLLIVPQRSDLPRYERLIRETHGDAFQVVMAPERSPGHGLSALRGRPENEALAAVLTVAGRDITAFARQRVVVLATVRQVECGLQFEADCHLESFDRRAYVSGCTLPETRYVGFRLGGIQEACDFL